MTACDHADEPTGRAGDPPPGLHPRESQTSAPGGRGRRQVFGLVGVLLVSTGRRFPGRWGPVRHDGVRSHSPLRGSPGVPPGSLLRRRHARAAPNRCSIQSTRRPRSCSESAGLSRGSDPFGVEERLGWACWFSGPRLACGCGVVRGNPVRIRDCPAAVSGNDRRHTHWVTTTWEATASRNSVVLEMLRCQGRARESEDLPVRRTPVRRALAYVASREG